MTKPYDPFYARRDFTGPARNAFPITPDDHHPPSAIPRLIYVGGAGDITVILRDDPVSGESPATGEATVPVVLKNVPAGTLLPLAAQRIMATGTTATLLVGLL